MSNEQVSSGYWSRRPPPSEVTRRVELIRCGPKGLKGVILSHELVGGPTHFWGGHMGPCDGKNCRACQGGSTTRWHGWLAIWHPKKQTEEILEITAKASAEVVKFLLDNQTLRGASFEAKRVPNRPNGRLWLRLSERSGDYSSLPESSQVKEILCRVWRITDTSFIGSDYWQHQP